MWKILICVGLTSLYCAQKSENNIPLNTPYQKGNIGLAKSPTVMSNPDYVKTKSGHKLVTDSDIDDVIIQKAISSYRIKDFQDMLRVDRFLNIGLLLGRLGVVLLMFAILWKCINRFTVRFVGSVVKHSHKDQIQVERQSLANTAGPILNSILHWILIGVTLLIVLTELGVDIMPIIYSFGVLGLAISIGAQTLVKDIISGVLTLFEGMISVGEIVEINGNVGTVEGMSLRAIEFRHGNGTMQIVAFSEIGSLINLSRDYTICSIVLPIGHEADIQEVEKAYRDVFNSLKESKEWKGEIIRDIELKGVLSITETAVYVKANICIKPDPHDAFGQEFRKRLFIQIKQLQIPSPKFASVTINNQS